MFAKSSPKHAVITRLDELFTNFPVKFRRFNTIRSLKIEIQVRDKKGAENAMQASCRDQLIGKRAQHQPAPDPAVCSACHLLITSATALRCHLNSRHSVNSTLHSNYENCSLETCFQHNATRLPCIWSILTTFS